MPTTFAKRPKNVSKENGSADIVPHAEDKAPDNPAKPDKPDKPTKASDKPIVAFVHGENSLLVSLTERLAKEDYLNVVHCQDARQVADLFHPDKERQPNMIIADFWIPHGGLFQDKETCGGLCTGRILYEYFHRYYTLKGNPIPFILFTSGCADLLLTKESGSDPYLETFSINNPNFTDEIMDVVGDFLPRCAPWSS